MFYRISTYQRKKSRVKYCFGLLDQWPCGGLCRLFCKLFWAGGLTLLAIAATQASPLKPVVQSELAALKKELTLALAIQYALDKNPSLKVFRFRDLALQGEQQTAALNPAYRIGFEAENFAGSDQLAGLKGTELTISLSSVIEMGDKRTARVKVVNRRRVQLEAQSQIEALELLGEVTRRFADLLAAQERVNLAEEAFQLTKETLFEVAKRSTAGVAPKAEVMRAQAALAQAELALSSERQQHRYFKLALTLLWGEKAADFSKVAGNLYQPGKDIEFAELYDRVRSNPMMTFFNTQERLQDAQLRLARTQQNTDIRWSVGFRQLQQTNDTAIVAGFSVPLFSTKRAAGTIASAIAARDEVAIQKEAMLLKLHAQLYRSYSNRQQAILALSKLQNSIIPSLQQALKETQQAYQRGRYSYLDYLTARQELITARRTQIEAALAALRYAADIEQLTSEPLLMSQPGSRKNNLGRTP